MKVLKYAGLLFVVCITFWNAAVIVIGPEKVRDALSIPSAGVLVRDELERIEEACTQNGKGSQECQYLREVERARSR